MTTDNLVTLHRRYVVRALVVIVALLGVVVWGSLQLLKPTPPHSIVLASGELGGLYHRYAQRYAALLADDGIRVDIRTTHGAGDNLALLLDPDSGVDVGFMQGGVAAPSATTDLVMLASLYYEPAWVFYRADVDYTQLDQLKGKRIGIGLPGSGTRALVEALLALNGITHATDVLVATGGEEALVALKGGQLDAVLYVGGATAPYIAAALRDPGLKLMSVVRADAYVRRLPYINRLTLPAGTVDLATDIPPRDVTLIATKAMLVARADLHPALIDLLLDAAREVHAEQGYFEAAGEFPNVVAVDLPVSPEAIRHQRFGPSLLHRHLPFWVATFLERFIILVVPILVVFIPLLNFLPQFLRWRVRSRIYRWYGELALLERDVRTREGVLPVDRWLTDLDRIERAVGQIPTPQSFASEAYTLREHVALVRRAVLAKMDGATAPTA